MRIDYHGHSCIQVTHDAYSVIIDPFLTGNPVTTPRIDQIKVQYILLTHGHSDHITGAIPLAKQNDAPIVAVEELAVHLGKHGVGVEPMHAGGAWDFPFGRVYLTPALHASSSLNEEGKIVYTGSPVGIILQMGGVTLYHAGDTGLFGDMRLLGERFDIDIAFLPIGGRFTMDPGDASVAAEWIGARYIVPIHYNTFPVIEQDAAAFIRMLRQKGIAGTALEPGQHLNVQPKPRAEELR
ncbi:metal-dependent hydrolase [Paenibacillus sp. BK720]|uniref:metal-dependent hydrolase n=1 Tax=Paenibacillus sp. BK720 TaxID=2587092 RepID=UPI00141FBA72|nr:metal-dependent hydrolase [Paenibacillus sp. BK720]NIK70742.1 L-ascorbate metabolism protein UlaG (beta-lactamase superfamily) [Paenibacillus sp. BK720]